MRTSMAQAFTAAGDGYVLRGKTFEWDDSRQGNSPHLDRQTAASLLRDVIELTKGRIVEVCRLGWSFTKVHASGTTNCRVSRRPANFCHVLTLSR